MNMTDTERVLGKTVTAHHSTPSVNHSVGSRLGHGGLLLVLLNCLCGCCFIKKYWPLRYNQHL